ncbi:MAG: GTP cyclohydrolase MptA [Nitrososphaerales archaeon]
MNKNTDLPDIHYRRPEIKVSLNRVGIVGIKMPIGFLSLEEKPVILVPTFDAFVDLPMNVKGIHASRNYEVIMEVIGSQIGKVYKLEDVCAKMAKELLERHEYASRAEVRAKGEVIVDKLTLSTGIKSYETFDIFAQARVFKENGKLKLRKSVGVGVTGITACPCAQEVLKDISKKELAKSLSIEEDKVKMVLDAIPHGTHMQRAYGVIITEIPEKFSLDAKELVNIVELSMSSSTFGLLKRVDEANLVKEALSNPRFAEDVVRHMVISFIKEYKDFPDDTQVHFSVRSFESIHKHDFVAEISNNLGHIKKELNFSE